MSSQTVAGQFAQTLATAGGKRIYGIVEDGLNGLIDGWCSPRPLIVSPQRAGPAIFRRLSRRGAISGVAARAPAPHCPAGEAALMAALCHGLRQ